MSIARSGIVVPALLSSVLALSAAAQDLPSAQPERLDAVDHAARLERIRLTGDLGIPMLPPVMPDSPRDDIVFADRFPVGSAYEGQCDGMGPPIFQGWIPASVTGTNKGELFDYMVPTGYDPLADPVPLVIGYHGYGLSAASVAVQSTLDEEADARGWFYLAPTGLDDQLFGSLPCQRNIETSIEWMLDNYNIDPDRIYMVGFSMGGGVSASFAARHRDPDGIMIAALVTNCGTFDWTLAYSVQSQTLKDLLENPYNFGGPPSEFPFAYQRSSGEYFPVENYPPTVVSYDVKHSMGSNLWDTPTYVAYDQQDLIFSVRIESQAFINLMSESGVPPVVQLANGTLDPCTGNPAAHSWAVLDMPAVFDFLDGKVVNRHPTSVDAQIDRNTKVSYLDVTQAADQAFSWVVADANAGLSLSGVENVAVVDVDASLAGAGLAGAGPFAVDDTSADLIGHTLRVRGFDLPPAYFLDSATQEYLPGTTSDPTRTALLRDVGEIPLDAELHTNPAWTGSLLTTPDPVAPGATTQLDIDMPGTSPVGYLILGLTEGLVTVKGGNEITAWPFTPSLLLGPLPFDLSLPIDVPDDPGLSGAELYFQTVGLAGPTIDSISNMWVMHIE